MKLDHSDNLTADRDQDGEEKASFIGALRGFFVKKPEEPSTLYDALDDIIGENGDRDPEKNHERRLIANVLSISNLVAEDVMIPRVDIVAIDIDSSPEDLLALLAEKAFSRIPVFRETLDDIVGCVNSKDILVSLARGELPIIKEIIRDVVIVSPSLDALDLLLEMRESRKHMALVVDEFGGIDGLITIGDMLEAIVGEIDDEHTDEEEPQLIERADGTILADARVDIDRFEEEHGKFLTPEDDEDIDTLGGLAMAIAGRMPTRGEVLKHQSGLEIEILDADARRVKRLRIYKNSQKIELPEIAHE